MSLNFVDVFFFQFECHEIIYHCRTRGIAAGIAAGLTYIYIFIATKTYYNLEMALSLPGFSALCCAVAALGWILMYMILPETEGRSLENIENHFADRTKKMTDHKIPKSKKTGVVNTGFIPA